MLKRGLDLFLSSVALFIFSPLLIITAIFLKLSTHPKILFIQPRLGYLGKEFMLIKFCTMRDIVDEKGNLIPDNKRLTKFGRFLRKTSIDELPSLLNVLKGEMSLVGPRPLLVDYKKLFNEDQFRRHEVLPGLTGWAQINGRNLISWKKKFELDIWYVSNKSFWLDLKILLITLIKVILQSGINKNEQLPMERFKGE